MADQEGFQSKERQADHIAGLLEELRGYEMSGKTDRAKAVRDQLKALDVTVHKDGSFDVADRKIEKAVEAHDDLPAVEMAVEDGGKSTRARKG